MKLSAIIAIASPFLFSGAHGLLDAGHLTTVSTSANAYDASSCDSSGCLPSNTRDGSYDDESRWSCSGALTDGDDECTITYVFDEPQDIEELRIAFTYGDTRTRSLQVRLNDVLARTITSSGDTDELEIFSLESQETESLSLVSTGLDSDEWISLTEVVFMVEGNLDYQGIGCYADSSSDRVLTYRSTDSYLMTPDLCAANCEDYAYFGTQYGEECWCGVAGIDYAEYGTATCDYVCTGDSSTFCGGRYAFSLYEYE